jgi:hypothetical protein
MMMIRWVTMASQVIRGQLKGEALGVVVATITALSAVVVGSWQRTAHGQQKALTEATTAKREQDSRFRRHIGLSEGLHLVGTEMADCGRKTGATELKVGQRQR